MDLNYLGLPNQENTKVLSRRPSHGYIQPTMSFTTSHISIKDHSSYRLIRPSVTLNTILLDS